MRRALLIFFVIMLLANVVLVPSVVFAKTTVALGSRWNVDADEQSYDESLADHIVAAASAAEYKTYDLYGADTTTDNILSAASAFDDAGSDDTVFYIGHGDSEYVWHGIFYEEQWYIRDDAGNHVHDEDIYPHSACRNVVLTFLWSCRQGDVIGDWHWSGTPYGMPLAWLHTNDLSNDGYANPDGNGYTFIGFHGPAPYLTNTDPQFTEGSDAAYPLYSFAVEFYSALFGYYTNQRDVNEALDYAAIKVWGVRFSDCVLYTGYNTPLGQGRMVVYGDGDLLLPTG